MSPMNFVVAPDRESADLGEAILSIAVEGRDFLVRAGALWGSSRSNVWNDSIVRTGHEWPRRHSRQRVDEQEQHDVLHDPSPFGFAHDPLLCVSSSRRKMSIAFGRQRC